MPDEEFFRYMMARTSYICFVLDQHGKLDFNSASSLKQQSAGRLVTPLGHVFLNLSQPAFALTPLCCMFSVEPVNTNFSLFFNPTWARIHVLPHSVYARCQYIKFSTEVLNTLKEITDILYDCSKLPEGESRIKLDVCLKGQVHKLSSNVHIPCESTSCLA